MPDTAGDAGRAFIGELMLFLYISPNDSSTNQVRREQPRNSPRKAMRLSGMADRCQQGQSASQPFHGTAKHLLLSVMQL
jgi:hypothetical protein